MRVVVIGGGISGLATAFYVRKAHPGVVLHVLEEGELVSFALDLEVDNDVLGYAVGEEIGELREPRR